MANKNEVTEKQIAEVIEERKEIENYLYTPVHNFQDSLVCETRNKSYEEYKNS